MTGRFELKGKESYWCRDNLGWPGGDPNFGPVTGSRVATQKRDSEMGAGGGEAAKCGQLPSTWQYS